MKNSRTNLLSHRPPAPLGHTVSGAASLSPIGGEGKETINAGGATKQVQTLSQFIEGVATSTRPMNLPAAK